MTTMSCESCVRAHLEAWGPAAFDGVGAALGKVGSGLSNAITYDGTHHSCSK